MLHSNSRSLPPDFRARKIGNPKPHISTLSTHPMLYPVFGFLTIIFIGTFLLLLPFSSRSTDGIFGGLSFENALFMATSAACVNGLAVVSVGGVLTTAGQSILALLAQIGGIGVMALSTMIMLLAGTKMSFGQQSVLTSGYSSEGNINSGYILRQIIKISVIVETIGAVLLYTQFTNLPFSERVFFSVFHSISAFCNAGFSIWDNSMGGFDTNIVVNFSLMFLIICGGFGFLSLAEIINSKKNKVPGHIFTLHIRLVLLMTPLLIIVGTFAVLGMEWNGALAKYSIEDKFLVSIFQSVTSRSAGFSTINFSALNAPILFFIMILMFIGANPGSCGGGIKTTTAALIALLGLNRFLGREKTQLFNRTVPEETVDRAVRIFVSSVIFIAISTTLILHFETTGETSVLSQSRFLEIFFESVSAFSTCGLSMGITENLSPISKIITSVVMFVGRLGPLVLVQAVVRPPQSRAYYSEENIMVG
ncbi:potassium transporter KtrB [Fibrobacterales bacterium]|nr:potassium transporter KtrB [Fibrobacterales bacterium]